MVSTSTNLKSIVSFLALATAAAPVHGAPLTKRIAQVIADSTAKWEQACLAAGGGQQCNPLSVTAFTTLLAAAGPCEQQDAADNMIDLAHTLNSDASMIRLAQIFVQQPRNSPTSQAVPYCQSAPRNSELDGLFQCQFAGVDADVFVGGTAVGGAGTIPFGLSKPLDPPRSCPAHTSGGIDDGTQLVDVTEDPGVGSGSGSNDNDNDSSTTSSADTTTPATTTSAAPSSTTTSSSDTSTSTTSSSFVLQNGKDAQSLNAQFSSLTASSSCTTNEVACVSGSFAQCVAGAFVLTSCGAADTGLGCFALPLVNAPGTSVTCTTQSDAQDRIARTGATGGLTGSE